MDNKEILEIFNANNNKNERKIDKILFLILIDRVKFKINSKIYAEPAMQAGIISIITPELIMIVDLLINIE